MNVFVCLFVVERGRGGNRHISSSPSSASVFTNKNYQIAGHTAKMKDIRARMHHKVVRHYFQSCQ